MFKVFFTNLGYYSANESTSFNDAVKVARRAGFQSSISDPSGETVATYCPMDGLRYWSRDNVLNLAS